MIEVLNASKKISLDHFNVFSITPRVDFKDPSKKLVVVAFSALQRAILI